MRARAGGGFVGAQAGAGWARGVRGWGCDGEGSVTGEVEVESIFLVSPLFLRDLGRAARAAVRGVMSGATGDRGMKREWW